MPERFKFICAVHLLLIKGDEVLLLRRANTGYMDGKFSVVAGHMDGHETIKAAMIREAREEVGIELQEEDLEIVGVMHRFASDERMDFFLSAQSWSGEIMNMEPNKCDSLIWARISELPIDIIPYIERAIVNFVNTKKFDEFTESSCEN